MNILVFEIKRNIKSLLKWGFASLLITFMYLSFFEILNSQMDLFLEAVPKEVVSALNLEMISTYEGYFAFVLLYASLILGSLSTYYGMEVYLGEYRQKTSEFLFTKPVVKMKIILYKINARIILLLIAWVIFLIGTATFSFFLYDFNMTIFLLCFNLLVVMMLLFGFGCLIGSFVKNKRTLMLSVALTLVMYIVRVLQSVFNVNFLKLISFFNYQDVAMIVEYNNLDLVWFLYSIFAIMIMLFGSLVIFSNKDVKVL